ncbi:MAG: MFS transporter [Planctomycetes bacterium]|nr:MFS transporter [Planctomycetota bacterium]
MLHLSPLRRQLACLHAYALVTYPFACVPFLFLYFRQHGLGEGAYGEIVGAYYLAMFVCEVPTGVLADRWGRRPMLVAGPLLLASGFGTLLLWPTYAGFLVGEVLLGLGHAVLSGPPSALLYETLAEHGQQHRFLGIESRLSALRLLGTGSAFLIGGALARHGGAEGYRATIVATALGCVLAAVLALLLRPGQPQPQLRARAFAGAVGRELRKPAVAWLLGYWIVLFALLRFPFHDYQPYLSAAGAIVPLLHDPLFAGALFATLNLGAAPLSALVPKLVARCGRRPLFWGMPIVLCASMAVMGIERWRAETGTGAPWLVWLGVSMFFLQQVPFGMHWALLQEFVNHRIGSAVRTTVLSALSLGARAVYALLNVLLFHLQAERGMSTAFLCTAIFGLAAAGAVLWLRPRGLLRGQGPLD